MPKPMKAITEDRLPELMERHVQPKPVVTHPNGNGTPFDVVGFCGKRGIGIKNAKPHEGGMMYVLNECANDPSHKGKDAAIIQRANGQLAYKCFHDSCSSFGWRQLREKFDPGCYDRRNEYQSHDSNGQARGTKEESTAHREENLALPLSLGELKEQFPELPPAIIHGLLREGETANIIAASKVGKSWLMYEIGLCVATGKRLWDTFGTVPGDVLLLDNELRPEVLAFRLKQVCKAMNLAPEDCDGKLFIKSLRGQLLDIHGIARYLRKNFKAGQFKLIIIDAYYRILPSGMSENDNAPTTELYNQIDALSLELNCAFVLVHHASKGSQTGKAITDVGSGAGAMSRAADCHMVLRPHEEPGVVVAEWALRSNPPLEPLCLRFTFPRWTVADGLDPAALKPDKVKTTINQIAERVFDCLKEHGPMLRAKVRHKLQISGDKVNQAVELLLSLKRIEPCDIPDKNRILTGYRVGWTTVDNGGLSTSPDIGEQGAGLPKGVVRPDALLKVHHDGEQSSSPCGDSDNE